MKVTSLKNMQTWYSVYFRRSVTTQLLFSTTINSSSWLDEESTDVTGTNRTLKMLHETVFASQKRLASVRKLEAEYTHFQLQLFENGRPPRQIVYAHQLRTLIDLGLSRCPESFKKILSRNFERMLFASALKEWYRFDSRVKDILHRSIL